MEFQILSNPYSLCCLFLSLMIQTVLKTEKSLVIHGVVPGAVENCLGPHLLTNMHHLWKKESWNY